MRIPGRCRGGAVAAVGRFAAAALVVGAIWGSHAAGAAAGPVPKWRTKPGTYALIETSHGTIVCRLFTGAAPKTVASFIGLATGTKEWTDPKTGAKKRQPYYDGRAFYRVIDDFMIQGGGPLPDGTGSPGFTIPDEIDGRTLFDRPGRLGMANHGKPDSGDCQFFITIRPAPHLNHKHTIFGQVEEGQAVVNAIGKVPKKPSGDPKVAPWSPLKPVVMTVRIEAVADSAR